MESAALARALHRDGNCRARVELRSGGDDLGRTIVKLSDGEKLILVMLSEIYKHHEIDGEIDPDLVLTSIFNDKAWGLKWEYGGLFNNPEDNPPVVEETCEILNMYRLLTSSFNKLSAAEQARVKTEAAPFSDYVEFRGFDANNDEHFGVVSYLVKDLERYDELKGKYLNSHSSGTIATYRRMLKVFEPMASSYPHDGLSADQIIKVLKG
jgi:uncharacterized protein YfbU (UPF0304 family)